MSLGIISREKIAFVLVDMQDKFIPVMDDIDKAVSNADILVRSSDILKIPLIVTEHYPNGLGKTTEKIKLPQHYRLIEKINFSCFGNGDFTRLINELNVNSIVLFGIEAHVCILKTALEALTNNLEVHVVADAITSRTKENKELAIERMRQSDIFITSTEMTLFQLIEKAGTDEFKAISLLIK